MIISNQEVALHLKIVRNLTSFNSVKCALRASIYRKDGGVQWDATPINIIEKQPATNQNHSYIDENHFISRSFMLKYGANVQLNEICIFKLDTPLASQNQSQIQRLALQCELIQISNDGSKVVSVYNGSLYNFAQHQYIEMDYYSTVSCQVVGSVHRCHYKYQFHGQEGQVVDLRTYCQKIEKFGIYSFLSSLETQVTANYQSIVQNYRSITKKTADLSCSQSQMSKQISILVEPSKFREMLLTEEDEERTLPMQQPKQRNKIFSNTQESKVKKYQTCEKNMHQTSRKIYALWQRLIASLFSKEFEQFMLQGQSAYRQNLIEKVGESVTRFKGNWDVDSYGDQSDLRSKLAEQLRNQNLQIFKSVDPSQSNLLAVLNDSFFSNERPIFFQENAVKTHTQDKKTPCEIFVVLVHGLGACRQDMEKIKVQLKRYYNTKVRIFVSSTNEGRTEGDIDSMGMRLAAQVDYELSLSGNIPKICMVGHSMGGLIIRSALPRLQKYKQYFHSLITLSTPHLGYSYSDSKIVDAGLWLLGTVKKCTSIQQMTMEDSPKPEDSFLYKLSMKTGLEWFSKVVLVSSRQDLYVPYYSARIQKHKESLLDNRKKVGRGVLHCGLVDNILEHVKGSLTRLDVNFCIHQNIDSLIGRAAHISLINNVEMARTLVVGGGHFFF